MPTPQTTPSDPTCPGLIGRDFFLIRLALPLLFLIAATRPVLAQIPPGAAELRIYAGLHAAEIARLMAAGETPNMQDARKAHTETLEALVKAGANVKHSRSPWRHAARACAEPRLCRDDANSGSGCRRCQPASLGAPITLRAGAAASAGRVEPDRSRSGTRHHRRVV